MADTDWNVKIEYDASQGVTELKKLSQAWKNLYLNEDQEIQKSKQVVEQAKRAMSAHEAYFKQLSKTYVHKRFNAELQRSAAASKAVETNLNAVSTTVSTLTAKYRSMNIAAQQSITTQQAYTNSLKDNILYWRQAGISNKEFIKNLEYSKAQYANLIASGRFTPAMQADLNRVNNELTKTKALLAENNKQTQQWTISWRSIARLAIFHIMHRILSSILNMLRHGIQDAIKLSTAIAEIRTIDTAYLQAFEWQQEIASLSTRWGFAATDVAESAYQTLSNQVAKGADAMLFLEQASKLAKVGVTTLTGAVQMLTGVLNAYNYDISYTNEIAAKFYKTIELGRIRARDMENMGDVAVMARQINIELDELLAAIATITIAGIPANKAFTQLRGIFVKFLKPTKDMKEFLLDIGVASGEAAFATYGFAGVMELLQTKTRGQSTELAKMVSRIRGMSGALIFTGKGLDVFSANLEKIKNASVSYERQIAQVFEAWGQTYERFWNKARLFFIESGTELGKALYPFIEEEYTNLDNIDNLLKKYKAEQKELESIDKLFKTTTVGRLLGVFETGSRIEEQKRVDDMVRYLELQKKTKRETIEEHKALEDYGRLVQSQLQDIAVAKQKLTRDMKDIIKEQGITVGNIEDYWFYVSKTIGDGLNKLEDELKSFEQFLEKFDDKMADFANKTRDIQLQWRLTDTQKETDRIQILIGELRNLKLVQAQAVATTDYKSFEETSKSIFKYYEDIERIRSQAQKEIFRLKEQLFKPTTDIDKRIEIQKELRDQEAIITATKGVREQILEVRAAYVETMNTFFKPDFEQKLENQKRLVNEAKKEIKDIEDNYKAFKKIDLTDIFDLKTQEEVYNFMLKYITKLNNLGSTAQYIVNKTGSADAAQTVKELYAAREQALKLYQVALQNAIKTEEQEQLNLEKQKRLEDLNKAQLDYATRWASIFDYVGKTNTLIEKQITLLKEASKIPYNAPKVEGVGAQPFASGGYTGDTIPALLSRGEFVMNAASTAKFLPQLIAMNKMQPTRMSSGGMVDVGGINVTVNESSNPQVTTSNIVDEINRGLRSGRIKFYSRA